MRESLGGGLLLNLVVFFTGIVIVFFVGILSYSKAYRIKNRIIEIIEKYGNYVSIEPTTGLNSVTEELNSDLKNAGYNVSKPTKCDSVRNDLVSSTNGRYDAAKLKTNLNSYGYNYCVFESTNSGNGKYYVVVTFVRFEVPIVGDLLEIPVYGETKMLNKNYDY